MIRAIDKHANKYFTVMNNYDLNLFQSLLVPHGCTEMKTVGCGPCKSDPVTIKFSVKKSKYFENKIKFSIWTFLFFTT